MCTYERIAPRRALRVAAVAQESRICSRSRANAGIQRFVAGASATEPLAFFGDAVNDDHRGGIRRLHPRTACRQSRSYGGAALRVTELYAYSVAGHSLRVAAVAQEPGIHRGRGDHARARHRSKYCDLWIAGSGIIALAAGERAGATGHTEILRRL